MTALVGLPEELIGDIILPHDKTELVSASTTLVMPAGSVDAVDSLACLNEFPGELPIGEVVMESGARATGSFADVHRATYKGQLVALKALRLMPKVGLVSMNRKVERESRTWWQLKHENVLPLLGFVDNPALSPYKLLVSPWCELGNLEEFMENNRNMAMNLRVDLFYEIAKGLNYLHCGSKSVVVHGDLKPANILIDSDWVPKLCDFGLVRIIHDGLPSGYTTTSNQFGTTRYLAPELVENSRKPWWKFWTPPVNAQFISRPTKESDVYALGSIGMEIMTSIKPYAHVVGDGPAAHFRLLNEITTGHVPARRPHGLSDGMKLMWKGIFEETWKKKAERRPSAEEVCALIETHRNGAVL